MFLQKLKTRAQKVNNNEVMRRAVVPALPEVKRMINFDQLFGKGEGATGKLPAYEPSTKRTRSRKGLPTDRRTLRDTGEMQDSMNVMAGNTSIEIEWFRDEKGFDVAAYWEQKYKEKRLLYLNDGNINRLIEEITSMVQREFKRVF